MRGLLEPRRAAERPFNPDDNRPILTIVVLSPRDAGASLYRRLMLIATMAVVGGLVCLPAGAAVEAPQVSDTFSVTGVVRIVTRSTRRLASAGAYPGRTVTVAGHHDPTELSNVLVFVDAPRTPSAPTVQVVRQIDEEFVPHLVGITAGSTVEFPNDDLLFHNVFSLSRAAAFDLGRYPRGRSKSRMFDKAGIVKVYCHLHSHMSALVRVFEHPYFVVPDADGRFEIRGLAPGPHTVIAWHERVGDVSHDVVVGAGSLPELAFSLPLTEDE